MWSTYERLGLHVSASYREVIRAARRVLTKRARTRECRQPRQEFLRQMMAHHDTAQAIYRGIWRL